MTLITGKIEDSGGVGLTGVLRVTLDAPLIDTTDTPDSTQVPAPKEFAVTSGNLSITLTQSATASITYRFEFFENETIYTYYFANGDLYSGPKHQYSDGNWYTGTTHSVDSELLFEFAETRSSTWLDFHAIVPNQAECEFASLLPTGITTDILDTSLRRMAEILTGDVDYVEILRGGPRFAGTYASTTYYSLGDAVTYGGSSWIWVNSDPGVNSAPSLLNPDWQLIAQKGDAGGTGGTDSAYSSVGWDGALWAPSANAIRDKIETLAPIDSPVFTGNPQVPLQLLTDATAKAASTLYVTNKLSDGLTNATFTTQANTDNSTKPATTAYVKNIFHRYSRITDSKTSGTNGGSASAGINTRTLNTIVTNAGDIVSLSSNTFTLRPGTYRIRAIATAYQVGVSRLFLWSVTAGSRTLQGLNAFCNTTEATQIWAELEGIFTIAVNTDFQVRHYCASAAATFGFGVAVSEASVNETYAQVTLWRLD